MEPLIIGRVPEPNNIGGVGIFVSRLLARSNFLAGHRFLFFSTKSRNLIRLTFLIQQASFVHYNGSNPVGMFVVALLCRVMKRHLILSIHGEVGLSGGLMHRLESIAINYADEPVVGQGSIIKARRFNPNASVCSAFIPPVDRYDEFVESFVDSLKSKNLAVTNANSFGFDPRGNEIYGITHLVEFFERQDDLLLIIVDSSGQYSEHYLAEDLRNVVFINNDIDYFQLLKHCRVAVRFTSTDGDSISVLEAIFAGIPVVATDCIERPVGCVLCEYGNLESLATAIATATSRSSSLLGLEPPKSAAEFYDKLYFRAQCIDHAVE